MGGKRIFKKGDTLSVQFTQGALKVMNLHHGPDVLIMLSKDNGYLRAEVSGSISTTETNSTFVGRKQLITGRHCEKQ